jgi:hypothetical protein
MKSAWMVVLALTAVCGGCVSFPATEANTTKKTSEKPVASRPARAVRVMVTPDLINETNGHQMGKALMEELNRESPEEMDP